MLLYILFLELDFKHIYQENNNTWAFHKEECELPVSINKSEFTLNCRLILERLSAIEVSANSNMYFTFLINILYLQLLWLIRTLAISPVCCRC